VKEVAEIDGKSPVVFKPSQPDSPIGVDFDETRAVRGKEISELLCLADCLILSLTISLFLFMNIHNSSKYEFNPFDA